MEYLFVYLGGEKSKSPEEDKRQYQEYLEWMASLKEADAVVVPETPVKDTHVVKPDGMTKGSATAMMGYTVIRAGSLAEALKIAQACPFLKTGGNIEVSELIKMPGN